MRFFVITVLFFITCLCCKGQDSFSFEATNYSFDTLYEEETSNAVFLLRNTSKQPIFIKEIITSEEVKTFYSTEPVLPGFCSMITATFHSRGYNKSINQLLNVTISTSVKDTLINLLITGSILKGKRPQTSIKFEKKKYDLGKLEGDQIRYYKIDFLNKGTTDAIVESVVFTKLILLQATGLQHTCGDADSKPLVGSNEVIRAGARGTILLKLTKNSLEPGIYTGFVTINGNFRKQELEIRLEIH